MTSAGWVFYGSAVIAIACTAAVLTRSNAMHALIYLVLVFLSTAAVFASLGATLVAALQIIIYAGAIMVLFVFIVMMLNLGETIQGQDRGWMCGRTLVAPIFFAFLLLVLFVLAVGLKLTAAGGTPVGPKAVGISLFRTYYIGVEVASLLLLTSLVGAFHFGLLRGRVGKNDD